MPELPSRYSILLYLEESRRPFTSIVFVLPILAVYEAGVRIINAGEKMPTVNAADAYLKYILGEFGYSGPLLSALLIVVTLFLMHAQRNLRWNFHAQSLAYMVIESTVMALPLFGLDMLRQVLMAAGADGLGTFKTLVLVMGSGVYEEFLFRLLLMGGLLWLGRLMGGRRQSVQMTAILLQALLFAVVHHVGPYGEGWSLSVFAFRTIAGVYFAWIFMARGFGIAAGCHTAYNLLIMALRGG
jgi:membrane protease YdiL (CAAX protease family)